MINILCIECGKEIDLSQFKSKTKAYDYMRQKGWSVSSQFYCPECRKTKQCLKGRRS